MIPGIDSEIGMLVHSTGTPGCGGRIKSENSDFEVSEVLSEEELARIGNAGRVAVFVLEKDGIDTTHALADIKKQTGMRLAALGLKDASAITMQYVYSTSKVREPADLVMPRYSLRHAGFSARPLSKRGMIGNRFRIVIRDAGDPPLISPESILNFYGYQRFGSRRPVTHLVGKALMQGRWEDAAGYILGCESGYDTAENNARRRVLADAARQRVMPESVPRMMDAERTVLRGIKEYGDFKRALIALPLGLRRFYVQAYQSYIFNRTISAASASGEQFLPKDGDVCFDAAGSLGRYTGAQDQRLALPLAGYAHYKKTRFEGYIQNILDGEDASHKEFGSALMPEVAAEGGFREALMRVSHYESTRDSTVSFMLGRGSYATILLREIMKPPDPLAAGF